MKQYYFKAIGLFLTLVLLICAPATFTLKAQVNLAPLATFSASPGCSTGPCTTFNDLNLGSCGTQQVWISGGNGLPPGQVWIMAEWSSPQNINEIIIHHAQNNTRFLCGALIQVWKNGAWVNHHTFSNLTLQCINSVAFPNVKTDKMRLTAFVHCGSQLSNANFREIEIIQGKPDQLLTDIAVGNLVSPSNPNCNNDRDLTITIANPGKLARDSAIIGGIIRTSSFGIIPIPADTFTGTIPSLGQSSPITVYSYSFTVGDTVDLWVKLPNGLSDSNDVNDSLQIIFRNPIPGKYYYVGPDTLNDHFRSIAEAVNFIDSIKGVCDSVIVEISDSTYVGQYSLSDLVGSSSSKPIIFRPKPTNVGKVILSFGAQTANDNYLFKLTNASHIYFENLQFSTFDGTSSNNSGAIELGDDAGYLYVLNCSFTNAVNTSAGDGHILIRNSGEINGPVLISNSVFSNGSKAISINGGSDHLVENCIFSNQFLHGVDISSAKDVVVKNNTISSSSALLDAGSTAANMGIAFYFMGLERNFEFSGNKVLTRNSQWPRRAVHLEGYDSKGQNCLIVNNMLNLGQAWSSLIYSGIYVKGSRGLRLWHNSVALAANNKDNAAFYLAGGTNNQIYNNSFSIFVNGYTILNEGAGSLTGSDNNNLYSTSNNLARYASTDIVDLNAWQAATSLDANSISYNPNHYSLVASDLHVCNLRLYQAGRAATQVTHDYDGDPRDPNMPCIGADEFAPVSNFSLGADYGLCPGDSTILIGGSGNFGETAIWSTNDTGQFLNVNTPGTYSITLLNQCGVSVDTIEIIQPQATALGGSASLCAGASRVLDASITNGVSYVWNNGDVSNTLTVTAPNNNTLTSATYSVTATDKWGCVSTDQVNLTYRYRAQMSIKDTIVCEGGSVSLFSGVATAAGRTYSWAGYDNASIDNTDGVIIIDIQFADKDTVIVTVDDNGCISNDTTYIEKLFRPKSVVGFTQNGMAVYFDTNNSTGNQHFFDFGENNATSSFANPSYLFKSAGAKTIMYVNSNRCGSDTVYMEFLPFVISVGEEGLQTQFKLYPNPNAGQFVVELENQNTAAAFYEILDVSGRTIFQRKLAQTKGAIKETITLENPVAGLYFIRVTVEGQTFTKRFTVN